MDTIKLSVSEREETGNGPARRLRAQGRIPGVAYGKGKTATAISIDRDELKAAMAHGHNVVLELDFAKDGKESGKDAGSAKGKRLEARYAVVKQLQFHPLKRHLLHVDLHEVDLAQEIEAPVVIEAVGTPAGVADGGIMDWERREVTVRALPGDMPGALELDVSELMIGQHLSVAALSAPEGVTIIDDSEAILLALVPPKVEQPTVEEEEEEGEEPEQEPEVIGEEASEETGS
jgi:large subunit ribosomal protein L25